MGQAIRDSLAAGEESLPIVAQRRNNQEWLVTMRAEDWFKLYRIWERERAFHLAAEAEEESKGL